MSISYGGIDLTDSVINAEFRLGVLERVIDRLVRAAPPGTLTDAMVAEIRKQVITDMQRKYPQAGITQKGL
jgi:hypothetical protein